MHIYIFTTSFDAEDYLAEGEELPKVLTFAEAEIHVPAMVENLRNHRKTIDRCWWRSWMDMSLGWNDGGFILMFQPQWYIQHYSVVVSGFPTIHSDARHQPSCPAVLSRCSLDGVQAPAMAAGDPGECNSLQHGGRYSISMLPCIILYSYLFIMKIEKIFHGFSWIFLEHRSQSLGFGVSLARALSQMATSKSTPKASWPRGLVESRNFQGL